jgi:hypothetical protein
LIDLPKNFISSDRTVRLYVDDGAGEIQRRELEEIFSGEKGGQSSILDSLVSRICKLKLWRFSLAGEMIPRSHSAVSKA